MYLFYVYGAGLGHLNRVLNFIYTTQKPFEKCMILTNSKFTKFIPNSVLTIQKEDYFFKHEKNISSIIKQIISRYKVQELIVDAFPQGFNGELNLNFLSKSTKIILLARLLNIDYFKDYSSTNIFNIIYFLERGIDKKHYNFQEQIDFRLEQRNNCNKIIKGDKTIKEPFFYIIHSSPSDEIELLYKQAKLYRANEHIYIQSFVKLNFEIDDNTSIIHHKQTNIEWLKKAKKIFSGCGFNTFIETKAYRNKQHCIPFKRKYDDQFTRKSYLKEKV